MHGHGKHILKRQTPLWLAQHPRSRGLSSGGAEKYGGDAALLVLIEVEEWQPRSTLMRVPDGGAALAIQPRTASAVVGLIAKAPSGSKRLNRFRHFQIAGTHLPVECPCRLHQA